MDFDHKRTEAITNYVRGLLNDEDGKIIYLENREHLERINPEEAFRVFHQLLEENYSVDALLEVLDKAINVFHLSLENYKAEENQDLDVPFLNVLIRENQGFKDEIQKMKTILREKDPIKNKMVLKDHLKTCGQIEHHYLKKENILFPYLEKKHPHFKGVSIMWALHDSVRSLYKETLKSFESEQCTAADLNVKIGRLIFAWMGLVHKEEYILFPTAKDHFSLEEWSLMADQMFDYNFAFMDPPKYESKNAAQFDEENNDLVIQSQTGTLTAKQAFMIFNHLPVDLTYVDEKGRVVFFNKAKERFFPRSKAVIGRDVSDCHPPKSLDKVTAIVEEFKANKRDHVSFWIQLKEKKILIQYFALRDGQNNYRGVLEVSQDITDLQDLEGEKRLLDF
ncbi:MAG TPA: PAS sensor protein [Eubacteriaceae bacterium]|nr:PAS sensor protein [Eubacteriaceae bacterium]